MRTRLARPRAAFGLAVLLLALSPAAAQALPSNTPDNSAFSANGAVRTIERGPNGVTYLGGEFTELRSESGPFASLSALSGLRNANSPQVGQISGNVRASVPDGAGGVYIGGDFSSVGGVARPNLAHILPDGSLDLGFNANPSGTVTALALSGPALYVGGSFATIGGAARSNIAKLSATSGNAVSTWNPGANGTVRAIAVDGAAVYAGGLFTEIGGLTRNNIARLSETSGNTTFWNPGGVGADGQVEEIIVSAGAVYAGGLFGSIGGAARPRLAKLSGVSGDVFQTFDAQASGPVNALALSDDELFVGGTFSQMGGLTRLNIAKLSTTTGNAFSAWKPSIFCSACGSFGVYALAVLDGAVFAGGRFADVTGFSRNNMAKFSAETGNTFSGWDANTGAAGSPSHPDVFTVSASGARVFAGGDFDYVNRTPRGRIAALDSSGYPTSWNPNAVGGTRGVLDIEVSADGGEVFAVGDFDSIGGLNRSTIAKLSAASGNAFSGFDPDPSGGDPVARVAVRSGTALYVGGDFSQGEDGTTANDDLAKYSTETGNVFTGFAPNPSAAVNVNIPGLAVGDDGAVYAGGNFTTIGGLPRARIAKLSGTTGNSFSAWDPGAHLLVGALEAHDPYLYVGGEFNGPDSIAGENRDYIAKLSTVSGNAFSGFNTSANQPVLALSRAGTELYAGGLFTQMGGIGRHNLAALTQGDGLVFGTFDPMLSGGVFVSDVLGTMDKLYVGGDFTTVGGRPRQGFAQFSQP